MGKIIKDATNRDVEVNFGSHVLTVVEIKDLPIYSLGTVIDITQDGNEDYLFVNILPSNKSYIVPAKFVVVDLDYNSDIEVFDEDSLASNISKYINLFENYGFKVDKVDEYSHIVFSNEKQISLKVLPEEDAFELSYLILSTPASFLYKSSFIKCEHFDEVYRKFCEGLDKLS